LKVENQIVSRPTHKLLWDVLKAHERRSLFGVFALILIGTLLETISVGMMIPVLSVIASEDQKISLPFLTINPSMDKSQLIQLAVGLMLAVYVIKNIFLAVSTWTQRGFLTRVSSRVAARMLEVYIRQPYAFHLRKNSSTLIRNTQDASMVVAAGIEPMLTILTESLIAAALFLVLVIVEPVGTVCVVGLLLVATFVFQRFFDQRLQRWGTRRQIQKGSIIQTIQQGLGAVKDVQVLGREEWFVNEHRERQTLDANLLRRINTVQALPRLWLEVMAMAGLAGLVAIMLATGKDIDAIIPTVGLFAATSFKVLPSINKVVNSKQTLKVSRSTIETIHQDLDLPIVLNFKTEKSSFQFESVAVDCLNFKYEQSEKLVLTDINVKIRSGEAVGFVGQSGSGKSTLIDIMLGLLTPLSGSVVVNEQEVSGIKNDWQKTIGYIPQTIFLMDDSLRRNIAIGIADAEIDEYAIIEALKSAQLEDFVASLPEGLDTVVGERGVRLSGGQRQRIGIARALYHRPSVLVLDEATSSLDTETEHGVMQAVQALQGDKTVIIVAHRLSTVEYCDRLYRLDAGRIVDEGTFDEVMNRSQS
jgi:ABC-type multidrug transport system fused ATPase/permease subunit